MSEGYTGKKGIANFFSKLFNASNNEAECVQLKHNELQTSCINSGCHNKIGEVVHKLADIAINSRIKLVGYMDFNTPMDIPTYLDIVSKAELLPYGESILATLNSTEDFSFEFRVHKDSNNTNQIFCIIEMMETGEVLSIFKVTENQDQFRLLSDFLLLADMSNTNGLEHFIYRHICGVILNYVKLNVSRFPLPEQGFTYIIEEWPNKCSLVEFMAWSKQEDETEG